MGNRSLECLKRNTRFRIISIFRDHKNSVAASNLARCDPDNYKAVTVHSLVNNKAAIYYCLDNTLPDDFRRYFTNKFHLLNIDQVTFTKTAENSYTFIIQSGFEEKEN